MAAPKRENRPRALTLAVTLPAPPKALRGAYNAARRDRGRRRRVRRRLSGVATRYPALSMSRYSIPTGGRQATVAERPWTVPSALLARRETSRREAPGAPSRARRLTHT